jgi:hypothetical protein
VLAHASTALHVLVTVFRHELPVVVVLTIFTVAPLQLSDAVGAVKVGVAVHSNVEFAPGLPIDGG